MNHKCVKCGKVYEHAAEEILSGCICGSKLFYFIKSDGKPGKKKDVQQQDVEYFYELEDDANNEIMIFDIEAINVKSSGKYELNLDSLMNNDECIYKYGDGKYSVDIDAGLKQLKKNKR